ncbi:hypothetical protein EUGRSUZ_L03605 [Eucalyptus grandis]|uniref:Uncharacterized protein n=1 Tax=Eucalyptus grandis TaxID=71139 RepID=A0AAD9T6M3_EUCGR|nr:hypothetical protein EUGRSUZ_L03605 [Eucalyptus grandis]
MSRYHFLGRFLSHFSCPQNIVNDIINDPSSDHQATMGLIYVMFLALNKDTDRKGVETDQKGVELPLQWTIPWKKLENNGKIQHSTILMSSLSWKIQIERMRAKRSVDDPCINA